MLHMTGFEVFEVAEGSSAIELLRGNGAKIDVVLLDMTLPGMSGAEVLSELHRIQPQVTVILTTAYSEEKVLNDLGGQRSWAFIRKPYQFGDLVNLLQRALLEKESSAARQ